jgi:hypothetical protein
MVGLTLLTGCDAWLDGTLNARIDINTQDGSMILTNYDDVDWTDCLLTLNPHGSAESGFTMRIAHLSSREVTPVFADNFADERGKRFQIGEYKIFSLLIHCDTPRGPARYSVDKL